jgi:apolipoprotein N-acyltransferase
LGKESFLLFFPVLWVAHEFLRANAFTGFPWNLLGYSQSENLNIIQIADITGVYGISFLVAAANSALYCVLKSVSNREFRARTLLFPFFVSCLLLAALMYGYQKINHTSDIQSSASTRIGVLQGNIPQDLKWEETQRDLIFSRYENLAAKAVQEGAKLVIWPETSVPVLFGSTDPDWKKVPKISERLRIPMMIGAPTVERDQSRVEYFNSAILLNGYDFLGKYDKVHLVPFGEYMPLSWILPLGPGIAAREIDFTQGKNMTVLPFDALRFGTLICYEAIFPELAGQAVANGANCLVNITNDGWFGNTAAPKQHLEMARFRSVENGLWMLRAANTGISAAFDQVGRVVHKIDLNSDGFFVADIPSIDNPKTFYSRFGDVFAWMCVLLTFVTFGYAVSLKPRIQCRGLR